MPHHQYHLYFLLCFWAPICALCPLSCVLSLSELSLSPSHWVFSPECLFFMCSHLFWTSSTHFDIGANHRLVIEPLYTFSNLCMCLDMFPTTANYPGQLQCVLTHCQLFPNSRTHLNAFPTIFEPHHVLWHIFDQLFLSPNTSFLTNHTRFQLFLTSRSHFRVISLILDPFCVSSHILTKYRPFFIATFNSSCDF